MQNVILREKREFVGVLPPPYRVPDTMIAPTTIPTAIPSQRFTAGLLKALGGRMMFISILSFHLLLQPVTEGPEVLSAPGNLFGSYFLSDLDAP
jgi:hypothetical protein